MLVVASKVVVLGARCSGMSSLCEQLRVDHRSVIECDVSHWFESQLDNYANLGALGLIDVVLDGTLTTAALANKVADLAQY